MANSTTFNDVFEDIKSRVSLSAKGKKLKNFNRQDFDRLAKAFLNTPDYTYLKAVTKGDSYEEVEVKPVQEFRQLIRSILLGFGVDKQEAERALTDVELVKNASGIYEFVAELVFQYLSADKKFDFPQRSDFTGSIYLSDVAEVTKTHLNPQDKTKSVTKNTKQHRRLDKKSKAPKWLKHDVTGK
jgi:hypothetical protein